MLASVQPPPALVELAVPAEVSAVAVLDAAVVSVPELFSFLPQAATARVATASVAILNLDTTIVLPLHSKQVRKKPLRSSRRRS
jgi:hypothetical protein